MSRTARSGQAGIVLLSGEPGIGKTALLTAIAERGRQTGFWVGSSKAEEFDQIAPLAPLLVALRSGPVPLLSRDDFNELAPLYGQQLWLVDRLTAILERRAAGASLLIAIDDLHWADPLSVFALRVMPTHLAGFPIVWLFAARTRPAHPVHEIVAAAAPNVPVERIDLAPLEAAAIDELALDRHGVRPTGRLRELLHAADGYPFLAVELLDGYARGADAPRATEELPSRFVIGVRSRLESLSDDTLRLVQVGSVLGRSFSVEDAAELLHVVPWTLIVPSIQAAVRAGVLEDDGDRIAFRHDLFRQAVYEDVPRSMRIGLHRSAAQRFRAQGRRALEAAPHVLMYALSGDRQAVEILRGAAAEITATMPTVAVELIERAFSLLPAGDPLWPEVGLEAITILTGAQRAKDALRIADELLAGAIAGETAANVCARAARILWDLGSVAEMRSRLDAALELADVTDRTRAELAALRALAGSREGDWVETAAIAQCALGEARRFGNRTAEANALRALGEAARNDGRHAIALGHFRALRAIVDTTSPVDEVLSLQLLDQYEAGWNLLTQVRRESEDRCDESGAQAIVFAQMWQNYCLGRLDETEADARTLVQLCDDLQEQSYQHEARIMFSRVAQLRGDLVAARKYLSAAAADPKADEERRALLLALMSAWLAQSEGDDASALDRVRYVAAPPPGARQRWLWQPAWLVTATRIAVRGHDLDLAREMASRAALLAERNPNVATIAGVAVQADGLVRGDTDALARAVEILRASPRPLIRAEAAVDFGMHELAAGRRAAGVAGVARGWEIFNAAGAHGEASKAQQLLRSAGVRGRRWAPAKVRPISGWAALTETEQRVARLIADGHTNRSAASELVLSPNTVATHLRSIFGKLGVSSRSQLTRVVMSQPA